jgi:hypothetical protein
LFNAFFHAIETKIHDAVIEGLLEKHAVIGFDRAWNPLEILYNPVDNNTISVFHAMKAGRRFITMLGL